MVENNTYVVPFLVVIAVVTTGCPPTPPGQGTVTPGSGSASWPGNCPHPPGLPVVIDLSKPQPLDDYPPTLAPGTPCVGVRLTKQSFVTVIGATLEDNNHLNLCTSTATWTGQASALAPQLPSGQCVPTGVGVPVSATFTITYDADYDRVSPQVQRLCLARSRSDFHDFKVTGEQHLDDAILDHIRTDVSFKIDVVVATKLNTLPLDSASGQPLPRDVDARCLDWKSL